MAIPQLFGPYGGAALAYGDRLAAAGSNACWFQQDYDLLAPAIDVFTPLIYGAKCGRPATWGRTFLEQAPAFVPAGRTVQLILDAHDGPESLRETAAAVRPSWGLQIFDGARVFADPAFARAFQTAVTDIRGQAARTGPAGTQLPPSA